MKVIKAFIHQHRAADAHHRAVGLPDAALEHGDLHRASVPVAAPARGYLVGKPRLRKSAPTSGSRPRNAR